jgi:hypothetical protein
MKKLPLLVGFGIMALFLCSWGFLAHRTIHQISIYSLPKKLQVFFATNVDYIVYNSVRPDVRRKDDPKEETKHFIDIDAPLFGEDAINTMPQKWEDAVKKYSEDTLRKYGTVPWEVLLLKEKLTNAFRNKQKDSILFYAADLGHYISDAHVPLHTSINYDGQLSNQRGLHSLWESTIPELHLNDYNLYQKHKAKYLKNPQEEIWKVLRQSNIMLKQVFEEEINASVGFSEDKKFKRSERFGQMRKNYSPEFAKAYSLRLGNTVNERLLASSRCVADFWYTSWVDAGCPDLSTISPVSEETTNKMKLEQKAWKANQLLSKGWLQSRKATPEN